MSKKTKPTFSRFFRALGPGLITGVADDDPSGIATYSIAGAQHGLLLLWTALITWPLMAAVQMMCARVGMVTGMGLAAVLRQKVPKPLVVIASLVCSWQMRSISAQTCQAWEMQQKCSRESIHTGSLRLSEY